nr:DUF4440 domain-containing protein [Pantoea sp. BL1]
MLLEKLMWLECSLHGEKRNDRNWLEHLLHPEFLEITRSGMMVDRSDTIMSLKSEKTSSPIVSSNFRLIEISESCVILLYHTSDADGSRPALRCSYWLTSKEGQWSLVFHQGTLIATGA